MAGDNHAVRTDKHRVRPAKPSDRPDNLLDLLLGVSARVTGKWQQRNHRPELDVIWDLDWFQRLRDESATKLATMQKVSD
jgi:hypothetical protein